MTQQIKTITVRNSFHGTEVTLQMTRAQTYPSPPSLLEGYTLTEAQRRKIKTLCPYLDEENDCRCGIVRDPNWDYDGQMLWETL